MLSGRGSILCKRAGVFLLAGFLSVAVQAETTGAAKVTGAVTGKVVDANGKPVKGATVVVIAAAEVVAAKGEGSAKEKKAATWLAKGETDKDGVYKIEGVPVGNMRVAARVDTGIDHSFTFPPKVSFEVVGGKVTKIDDIKMKPRAKPETKPK